MRVTWDPSIGQATGYKVQMIPMMAGSKRQEVYVGVGQTSVVVRDLSPDVEYQISVYALKGLTPSEPILVMQKTEPVKVSLGEKARLATAAWREAAGRTCTCVRRLSESCVPVI